MSAWPSRAHSSSAMCGASGATINTSGSTTSRGAAPSRATTRVRWLLHSVSRAIAVLKPIDAMSSRTAAIVRCRTRRVSSSAGASDTRDCAGVLVDHVAPQPLQEAVHADDVGRVPRARRVERAGRHLVEAQRVGAVLVEDVVGGDHVLQALAHLAELTRDRLALEQERTVALDHLRRPRRTRRARRCTRRPGSCPGSRAAGTARRVDT